MMDNQKLLADYVERGSEEAFRELVARYINLVYSTALRIAQGQRQLAEDISQSVFVALAQKAHQLPRDVMLGGWLHQHTRFESAKIMRGEWRRQNRERQVAEMSTPENHSEADFEQIAPILDEVIGELNADDRTAIVLRFFEQKDLRSVGQALGSSEDAARKRVSRALVELEKLLRRRGIALSAAALGTLMAGQLVQAAPAPLASILAKKALADSLTVGKGVSWTKAVALTKSKLALMGVIGVAVIAIILLTKHQSWWKATKLVIGTSPSSNSVPTVKIVKVREPLTENARMSLVTPVGAVAVQPDGKILAASTLGGFFVDEKSGQLGYYARGALRFLEDGSLDRSFFCEIGNSAGSSAMASHLDLKSDGRIFLTGIFNTVDGKPRSGKAVLQPDGHVDESFKPWRDNTNNIVIPSANLTAGTFPAALLPDNSVALVSGALEGPRAPYPWTAHRLDSTGRIIPLPPVDPTRAHFSRPSGLIATLGEVGFWARKPIDWNRNTPSARRPPFQAGGAEFDLPRGAPVSDLPFERLTEPPSAIDAAVVLKALFDEVPTELCRYAVRLPDGGTVLALRTEHVNGSGKVPGCFMRFDKNWRPDFSFTNSFESDFRSILTLKRQKDGKLLLSGIMGAVNGQEFSGLVRLESNGAIDPGFHCETGNSLDGRVMSMAIQDDGRIVIGGFFSKVNGVARSYLARLNPDGSLDTTFQTPFVAHSELAKKRRVPVQRLSQLPAQPPAVAGTNIVATPEQETVLITSLRFDAGVAVIQFKGEPAVVYVLQGKDAFDSPEWSLISTNETRVNGVGTLRDEAAKNFPMRLYRIARP